MALMKIPEPAPSVVLLSAIVGVWLVLQQTPREVIAAPPSFVILPPLVAEVDVIDERSVVVTVDNIAKVMAVT